MIEQFFADLFAHQRIGILGFGREGISTYKTIRKYVPGSQMMILDKSELSAEKKNILAADANVKTFTGENYLEKLSETDLIVKSPGIPTMVLENFGYKGQIYSQADLFLRLYRDQVVGITGTKGKSTTSSLLHHILISAGRKSFLAGNIGVPPFEIINQVTPDSIIVLELSSHQLENCSTSPRISVLLNLFQEHLDHYRSYFDYHLAKANIAKFQSKNDFFITDISNHDVLNLINSLTLDGTILFIGTNDKKKESFFFAGDDFVIDIANNRQIIEGLAKMIKIPGRHNLKNVSAAALVAILCGLNPDAIKTGVSSFKGLPHRLEYVGEARGIHFYNDSISTIPQATIEALKAFPETSTLIAGGFDRGIDYKPLADFLPDTNLKTLILIGQAGRKIHESLDKKSAIGNISILLPENFENAVKLALDFTPRGKICLLSPAASSYDEFKNFEKRGMAFKNLVRKYSS